jgi:hypothetical protein
MRLPVQKCKNVNLTLYFVNQNGHNVILCTNLHIYIIFTTRLKVV